MSKLPVLDGDAVLAAVDVAAAIAATETAFLSYQSGAWLMPPKVYLDSAPFGDFRAMPARGDGFALLKWVTSFPGNRERGLPVVSGVVCLSDAETGVPLMLLDGRAVTALRTGAAAAVATRALARDDARTVGVIGCGVHGQWAARCLAELGFRDGVCADVTPLVAEALAAELDWRTGSVADALDADVVCCVTPGHTPVITTTTLKAGQHHNLLGADGPGKAEATIDAVASCSLFCDEWAQASHGGELTGAVAAGRVGRGDVTDLGAVLSGQAPGRQAPDDITLFDSTGLAIQDLGVALAAYRSWERGEVTAQTVEL